MLVNMFQDISLSLSFSLIIQHLKHIFTIIVFLLLFKW